MKNFAKILISFLVIISISSIEMNSQKIPGKSRNGNAGLLVTDCTAIGDTVYLTTWMSKGGRYKKMMLDGKWAKAYDESDNSYSNFEYKINNKYDFGFRKTLTSNESSVFQVSIKIAGIPDSVSMFKSILIPIQDNPENKWYVLKRPVENDEIQIVDVPIKRI